MFPKQGTLLWLYQRLNYADDVRFIKPEQKLIENKQWHQPFETLRNSIKIWQQPVYHSTYHFLHKKTNYAVLLFSIIIEL